MMQEALKILVDSRDRQLALIAATLTSGVQFLVTTELYARVDKANEQIDAWIKANAPHHPPTTNEKEG